MKVFLPMSRLSTWAVALSLCVSLVGTAAPAQPPAPKTMLALPPAPLLPATLIKWTRVAEGDSGDGLGLLDAPGFDPVTRAILLEDGLKRCATSAYALTERGPDPDGRITVYRFGDASGAVAAFDFFRKPGTAHLDRKLVDQVALDNPDGSGIVFRSGVNVVLEDFRTHADTLDAITRDLVSHLPKSSGPAALPPLLPTLLPAKGLQPDTVRYSLGPAAYQATGGVLPAAGVGFDKSAEVVTARYKSGGTLTMLLYPTPQIAGDHGRAIEAEMQREGTAAGTATLRREGPLVLLTTGPWKPAEAQALVDSTHLRTEVTFDKKMPLEFHAEVQKTYSLLTSISILCGIGALAAIVLGLFFGGGRALVRIMQGKSAASDPEFLRIDLRSRPADQPLATLPAEANPKP